MTREEKDKLFDIYNRLGGIASSLEQEPCEDVPNINNENIYKCSCGYGWDKSKAVRHHFCPNCGRAVDSSYNSIKTELKSCDDYISRQAAIRIAEQGQIQGYEWQFKQLCNLPPVKLTKTCYKMCGRWKDKIDKIRAEIEQTAKDYDKFNDYRRARGLWIALEVIDNYRAESEEV